MKYLLIAFLFLSGCASNGIKDFNCYKVTGPVAASGPMDQKDLEQLDAKLDQETKLFSDRPVAYMCIDVTTAKEPRQYPKGK